MDETIYNFVNAFVLSVAGVFSTRWVRKRKKDILRNRLSKDGWEWRSFRNLCRSIREDEATTRDLLVELGARASTKHKNLWTLEGDD